MLTFIQLSFPIFAVAIAYFAAVKAMKKTKDTKRSTFFNFKVLGIVFALFCLFSFVVSAETGAAPEVAKSGMDVGLGLIAAGLCTGLAGIGAGIALASGAPAAIGAVSEDPTAFGKALIFVALGETIALYGVVISFMILSKF